LNAGLSSLAVLKASCVAAALRTRTDVDAALITLGTAAAGMIEDYLSRKLQYVAGEIYEQGARCLVASLPRYPLKEVTALAVRDTPSATPASVTGSLMRIDAAAGLLHFNAPVGAQNSTLITTYSGGFWFDTTEDESGTMPSGATPLPAALRGAWLMQCQGMINALKLFDAQSSAKGKDAETLTKLDLLPLVIVALRPYRRLI
jgi:hypothetical protein